MRVTNFNADNWKFCPICGTPRPRPVEKSLAEKFREEIDGHDRDCFGKGHRDSDCSIETTLVSIAEKHFSEMGEK